MTYNERLNEIAEEMARAFYELKDISIEYQKGLIPDVIINKFKSSAAIALKHMAEMWEEGYRNWDGKHDIQSLGLIEPQNEKI